MTEFYKTDNLNEIVIGGSGAAKTYRKIKPDIAQMFGSYICTDPKGELYRDTAKMLIANGYKVRVLNCDEAKYSNGYNPFRYIEYEQDILAIADIFMRNATKGNSESPFWSGSAQDLLRMIMTYLWMTEGETKSFGRVLKLVSSISFKKEKIDPECELAQCMKQFKIDYPLNGANITWAGLQSTPSVTMGGIIQNLKTPLGIWSTEVVDRMTNEDEMDFDLIGSEKTAIFVIIPPADPKYKLITNIFYSQLFSQLLKTASKTKELRHKYLVSCELDEFANIGEIPNIDNFLNTCRSFNIRICIVLQSVPQLQSIYKDTWKQIIGNCSIFTFLGSNDPETQEYIVKKLGKTTIKTESRGNSQSNSGGSTSKNENLDGRDLVTIEELKRYSNKHKKKYGGSVMLFFKNHKELNLGSLDSDNATAEMKEKFFANINNWSEKGLTSLDQNGAISLTAKGKELIGSKEFMAQFGGKALAEKGIAAIPGGQVVIVVKEVATAIAKADKISNTATQAMGG